MWSTQMTSEVVFFDFKALFCRQALILMLIIVLVSIILHRGFSLHLPNLLFSVPLKNEKELTANNRKSQNRKFFSVFCVLCFQLICDTSRTY